MSRTIRKNPNEIGALHKRRALIDERQTRGSFGTVDNMAALYAIDRDFRKIGMERRVLSTDEKYKLISLPSPLWAPTTAVNWELIGAAVMPDCSRTCIRIDPVDGNDLEAVNTPCINFATPKAALDFGLTLVAEPGVEVEDISITFCSGTHLYHDDTENWAVDGFKYDAMPGAVILYTARSMVPVFDLMTVHAHHDFVLTGELTLIADGTNGSTLGRLLKYRDFDANSGDRGVFIEARYITTAGDYDSIGIAFTALSNIKISKISCGWAGVYHNACHGTHKVEVDEGICIGSDLPADTLSGIFLTNAPGSPGSTGNTAFDYLINKASLLDVTGRSSVYVQSDMSSRDFTELYTSLTANEVYVNGYHGDLIEGNAEHITYIVEYREYSGTFVFNLHNVKTNKGLSKYIILHTHNDAWYHPSKLIVNLHNTHISAYGLYLTDTRSYIYLTAKNITIDPLTTNLIHVKNDNDDADDLTITTNVNGNGSYAYSMIDMYYVEKPIKVFNILDHAVTAHPNLQSLVHNGDITNGKQRVNLVGDIAVNAFIDHPSCDWSRVLKSDDWYIGDIKYYIDASGNDYTGTGTSTKPFATLEGALRKAPKRILGSLTIALPAGNITYDLDKCNIAAADIYATDNIIVEGAITSEGSRVFTRVDDRSEFTVDAALPNYPLVNIDGVLCATGIYIDVTTPHLYAYKPLGITVTLDVYSLDTIVESQPLMIIDALSTITFKYIRFNNIDELVDANKFVNKILFDGCNITTQQTSSIDTSRITRIDNSFISSSNAPIAINNTNGDTAIGTTVIVNSNAADVINTALRNVKTYKLSIVGFAKTLHIDNGCTEDTTSDETDNIIWIERCISFLNVASVYSVFKNRAAFNMSGADVLVTMGNVDFINHVELDLTNLTCYAKYKLVKAGGIYQKLNTIINKATNIKFKEIGGESETITNIVSPSSAPNIFVPIGKLDEDAQINLTVHTQNDTMSSVARYEELVVHIDQIANTALGYSIDVIDIPVTSVIQQVLPHLNGNIVELEIINMNTGTNPNTSDIEVYRNKKSSIYTT